MNPPWPPSSCLLLTASLLASCKEAPAPSPRECHEALDRGRALLSVPDFPAARDWLARADKQCRADARSEVEVLRGEIDLAEKRRADAEEHRRREREPRPAAQSRAREVVRVALAYRDEKTRGTRCDPDPAGESPICEAKRRGETLSFHVATEKRDAAAYSLFTTLEQELTDCASFGFARQERAWKRGDRPQILCAIPEGPLAGVSVLLDQNPSLPSTDVTVFTERWITHDPQLALRLKEGLGP